MKLKQKLLIPFVFVFYVNICVAGEFSKQAITNVANRVANWQIKNFSYINSGNLHDYGIDAWTNGVFYLGLSRWADVSTEKNRYFDWLYNEIGEKNNWRIPENFINYPAYGIYHADELCIAQFYIEMYKRYNTPEMIESLKSRLNTIISNPPDGNMSYRNKKIWTWCDALFMAPPVFLEIAQLTNDTTFQHFMHQQFIKTTNHLFDQHENLYFRDDSYFDKREENGTKVFWGRGNGWVIAGLANILKALPPDSDLRPYYQDLFTTLANRLVQLQHNDGFWRASLLDPDNYPSPETSATALITYALAFGINNGILEETQYKKSLTRAWTALNSAVNDDGKIGWIQPIGADPKKVTEEMTAVYGVGAFLMAASEIYKMRYDYKS